MRSAAPTASRIVGCRIESSRAREPSRRTLSRSRRRRLSPARRDGRQRRLRSAYQPEADDGDPGKDAWSVTDIRQLPATNSNSQTHHGSSSGVRQPSPKLFGIGSWQSGVVLTCPPREPRLPGRCCDRSRAMMRQLRHQRSNCDGNIDAPRRSTRVRIVVHLDDQAVGAYATAARASWPPCRGGRRRGSGPRPRGVAHFLTTGMAEMSNVLSPSRSRTCGGRARTEDSCCRRPGCTRRTASPSSMVAECRAFSTHRLPRVSDSRSSV